MNDREVGKREIEREHLSAFLDAYEAATAESFPEMIDSETPDFIGHDAQGRIVGIEVTQLLFGPDEQDMRRIFPPNPTDNDAWFRLLDLMHRKNQTLAKGRWSQCERKILVIMLIDTSIGAIATGAETDAPRDGGFTEVWLVDCAQLEVFGAVDLFAVVHPELKGHFATGDQGQKPYG
jgi:hypothetical protein